MRKNFATALSLLLALLLSAMNIMAQQSKPLTESSFLRAQQVLHRGIEALGGLKNLQAIEDISYESEAQTTEIGQSTAPDAPYYLRPTSGEGVIDFRGKRSYRVTKTHFLGSAPFWLSIVTTEKSGFTHDFVSNAIYPLAAPAVIANNGAVQRIFPHQLLQLALNRLATLRWISEVELSGQRQQVITFADSDNSQLTLYFDNQTGLLTKSEGLTDGFLTGLAARETIFSNYQKVDGIMLPFRVVTMIGGEVTNDLAYTRIKLNTHPAVTVFEAPKSAEIGPEVGGPPQPITLTKLAMGVYYVNAVGTGSIFFYSSMFVAFKDYVLVVEAPLSDGVSQAVIAKIKETVPGKPIKYLVPTHYHVDHLGGVRGYIAEGSTIVTTPANRNLIETLAALVHPLSPDTLSLHPRPVSIETFKDKRVFSDGEQVVELYNVGPTPHVEEMVIAYLPHQKLVFVSDMFPVNLVGRSRQADPINIFFFAKIRELGLQIEKIASGHGRVGALAELESAAQSSGH